MDDLAALRLQIEWGADEALLDHPLDRFAAAPRAPSPLRSREGAGVSLVQQETASVATGLAAIAPTANRAPSRTADLPHLAAEAAAAAATLPALLAAMDAFHACPLRATASTTVAPSGNESAGLVLIGGAPGPDDDRAGHAFSGPPGATLDRILASAGLARDGLLLAPLIPWRPPGGRAPSDAELATCVPFLHRLLALLRPRHIVLIGAAPARAFIADPATLRRLRGKWTPVSIPGLPDPVPALPMLAADMWLANAGNRETTWTDLLSLKSALDEPA